MIRRFLALIAALLVSAVVGAGLVWAPAASASPETVDYVVNTIGNRVDQGTWRMVSINIQDLDRTIDDALNNRKVPVAVATNPVGSALAAVRKRGKEIEAEKGVLVGALNRLEKAESNARPGALALIFIEMFRELSKIQPTFGLPDVIDPPDATVADEIVRVMKGIEALRERITYMKSLIALLDDELVKVKAVRKALIPLNAQMNAVLAKYGITVGGPAVQPPTPTASHPSVGGVWIESGGLCSGARISITQDASGTVTAVSDDLPACSAAWIASNIAWESQYVLTYDYTVTVRPTGWQDGHHRVTFSPDGQTATMVWSTSNDSGTVPLTRG